jgi:hypothetical protein
MRRFTEWIKRRTLKTRISTLAKILKNITSVESIIKEGVAAQTETETYWSNPSFIRWLASKGVQWKLSKVPQFKDGGVGRAYFLGDKVVKFTDNPVEANVANMVAGRRDTSTRIHAVQKISNVYAILQDMVNINFPKTFGKAADILMAYVDEKEIDEFPQDPSERQKMAEEAVQMFEQKSYLVKYILEMMDVLDKLYRSTGFFHNDAMPQNLGMDKDTFNPVAIDLGPNQTKDFDPHKAMNKIHSKRQKLGLPPYEEI